MLPDRAAESNDGPDYPQGSAMASFVHADVVALSR
jgi:hypothetical protein